MVKGLVTHQVGLPVPTVVFGVTAWITWSNDDERGAAALVVVSGAECLWPASALAGSLLAGTELAVVAGVADRHGWTVTASNANGAGARIDVVFGKKR